MDKSQPDSPRARLQALLAIPDRQRSEAEWAELNELEIMLAVGNREAARDEGGRRHGGAPGGHQTSNAPPHGRKQARPLNKRPPRRRQP